MDFGLLFTFQVLPGQGTSPNEPYRDMLECLPRAEELNYRSAFLASHHLQSDGWCPSPLVALGAAAAVTSRMRLGTAVLLVPLYAPLKLAEDVAVLDHLSGGRFVLGVAPGYVVEEFRAHGVPREERSARMEEALDLLTQAWTTGEFSFAGRFYSVAPGTQLSPKPRQRPHPPIWYGVSGPRALRRAAQRKAVLVGSPRHSLAELKDQLETYRTAAGEVGFSVPEWPIIRQVFLAETQARAEELAAPGIEYLFREFYASRAERGERALRSDTGELITTKSQVDFQGLRDRFIIGSPEHAIEQVQRYREELGGTEILCLMHSPGVSGADALRSVELFAQEVMPAFPSKAA